MSVTAWLVRCALLIPLAMGLGLAVPRWTSGVASDHAFPVPLNIAVDHPLPISAYQSAEHSLAGADPADGEAKIERAETLYLMHAAPQSVLAVLTDGLQREPASARGWALLAELPDAPAATRAKALALSLQLAPLDIWLAGSRSLTGIALAPQLSPNGKQLLLQQIRLLWTEQSLRPDLHGVLATPGGAALVTEAFNGNADELRALNRWVTQDKLRAMLHR